MPAYILRRILVAIPTLVGMAFSAFLLAHLAPGDPARRHFERLNPGVRPSSQEVAEVRRDLALDRPLPVQFGRWAGKAVTGDLGTSYGSGRPVSDELRAHLPATLELTAAAALLALLLALPAGVLAAARHNRLSDHVLRIASLAGASMPGFWLALLLVAAFSVRLPWLPASGRSGWTSLVLPTLALAAAPTAVLARITRSTMLDALGLGHVLTARAMGISSTGLLVRHALRNASLPVVTAFGTTLGHLLGGAVIIESIFVWPGIGRLALDAIMARDYPLIQGFALYSGAAFVAVNLLVDLSYGLLDPRVRLGARDRAR